MWYAIGNLREATKAFSMPVWRDSADVCALVDDERHFGHVVRTERWQAFDATKLNAEQDGIRYLGSFNGVMSAKEAVEKSVGRIAVPMVLRAGG